MPATTFPVEAFTEAPPQANSSNLCTGGGPVQAFSDSKRGIPFLHCYHSSDSAPVPYEVAFASNRISGDSPSSKPVRKGKKAKKSLKGGEGQPKKALSAYNYFFADERKKLLDQLPVRPEGKPRRSHGKIGFVKLARHVGQKWRALDETERSHYDRLATNDKERYEREMKEFSLKRAAANSTSRTSLPPLSHQDYIDMSPIELYQESPEELRELARNLGDDLVNIVVKAFAW